MTAALGLCYGMRFVCIGARGAYGEGKEGKEGRKGVLRPVTGQEESLREAGEQHLCC